jgi:transposase InsO family protein
VNRLHEICHPHDPPSTRRGYARQRLTRERESILRGHIVGLTRWTLNLGLSLPETADLLHLAPRTLRHWYKDKNFLRAVPRIHLLGRPTLRSSRADRKEVLEVLEELGPATSVATLCDCFPMMSHAELEDLVMRYRRVWRHRHQHAPYCLEWTVPGTVWAMDFSEAIQPIDGLYPYLLAVRDLASSYQLLWSPVRSPSAEETILAVRSLFAQYGAPLVLKTDNGSAFIADATKEFLSPFGVNLLFSPPRTPRYNGSIEAGIGSLKTRTERHAARAAHPSYWTFEDVEHARDEANATARPHGPTGPTPNQLWEERRPVTTEQRSVFQTTVHRHRQDVNVEEGIAQDARLQPQEERRLNRPAIRRALGEHDYLLFTRRRIPLPITNEKVAIIT